MYKKEATNSKTCCTYINQVIIATWGQSVHVEGSQRANFGMTNALSQEKGVFLGYETEKFCFVCLSLHSTTLPKVATAVQQEVLHRKTATYNYYKTTNDQSTKSTGMGRACSSCTAPRKKILKCVCRKMFVPNRQSNALLIKNTLNGFYGRKQTHPQQRTVLHTLTHEDIVLGRTDVRRMSSCERGKI